MSTPRQRVPAGAAGSWWRAIAALGRQAPGLTALVVMAALGLAISAYLTTVHYASVPLVCSATGPINCVAVTSSRYSVIPGTAIPITIPGMLWFLASGVLAGIGLRGVWADQPEPARLRLVHFGWAAAGVLFVLYLIYCEIVLLHQICEWCTAVHVLTVGTFLLTLARLQRAPTPPQRASVSATAHSKPVPRRRPARRGATSTRRR
jgi:uncharacterized membrane protein